MANEHPGGEIWLPLDQLSRFAQIRAGSDRLLIDEYARAMLEGAHFPAVVVFAEHRADEVLYHLADGYHRADAAALAHAIMPEWRNEIRAEVRPGTFEDALRYALQANGTHGKRLNQADFGHAIDMALERGLVQVKHASEVVPALRKLIPGLSVRSARFYTETYRSEMTAKRDRLIIELHGEGLTQAAIAERLEVDQATVSRIMQNGSAAEMHNPPPPVLHDPEVKADEAFKPVLIAPGMPVTAGLFAAMQERAAMVRAVDPAMRSIWWAVRGIKEHASVTTAAISTMTPKMKRELRAALPVVIGQLCRIADELGDDETTAAA